MRGSASLPADPGEQFALVMNAVEDFALFLLDTEGKVVRWGRGAEKTLGFSEEEVLGQDFALIFTPEDRLAGAPGAEMATATREGRAADIRWHVRKDGSRLWCDGALSALRDEAGTLRGFVKVLQDATARRELEDRLLAAYQRDHRIAETLQQSLLLAPSINSLRGVRVQPFYEAALDEALVGGDFYDAFPLDGGRVVLAVVDASGKGVDAAARTAEVKSAVRAFMTEYPYPARTLMRVNEFLCSILRLREETQTFVTLALVVMDPVSGEVLCASAGNEPPLLVRADGQTAAVPVGGMPLGLYPDAEYEVISERILPNDTLLLTTDGLTETRREQEFLGFEGFARLAAQARSSPTLAEMGRSILEEARAFAGGTFRDDVCLLLAQLK